MALNNNQKRKKVLTILFLSILAILALNFAVPPSSDFFQQEEEHVVVITTPIKAINASLIINQSIIVNASFEIINSKIIFNNTNSQAIYFVASKNASVRFINCTITRANKMVKYYIRIDGASFEMINSTLIGAGYRFSHLGYGYGLWLHTNNSKISNSHFIENYNNIYVSHSENVTIENNTIIGGNYGIYTWFSKGLILQKNSIISSYQYGIVLFNCPNASIRDNTLTRTGIYISGTSAEMTESNITNSNVVDEKPVYYFFNKSNIVVDNITVGELIFAYCDNITISNIEDILLIELVYSKKAFIENITTRYGMNGLYIEFSQNIRVENVFVFDKYYGIVTNIVNWVHLENLTFENNQYGAYLQYTDDIIVQDSVFKNNHETGLVLKGCDNISITNNYFVNNTKHGLTVMYAIKGQITGNVIKNNGVGLTVIHSSNLFVFNNSFENNNVQAESDSSINWSDGTQGNYWSDYYGADINNDGIGDIPYYIKNLQFDFHPKCKPMFIGWLLYVIIIIFTSLSVVVVFLKIRKNKSVVLKDDR
ncbi:MAG: right-handed parallel beta-helix repeat-containing protein [Candidatus Asgardarchaeia archaeon]